MSAFFCTGVEELVRPLVNTLITLTNEAIEIASDGYSEDTDDLEAKSFPSVTGVKGVGPLVVISHQTRSHASDKLLFHLLEEYFNVNKVCQCSFKLRISLTIRFLCLIL